MNVKYDFTRTGGFPLDQGVLKDLQNGILEAEAALASLLGPLAIISGCAVSGLSAGNGVVAILGEILPFVGGTIGTKVIVVDTDTLLTYFDGSTPPSDITRYATFGDDGVQNNPWANFVRVTSEGVLADVNTLNGQIATANAQIATLIGQVSTLNGQVSTLNGQVSTLNGQVSSLNALVAELETDVTALEAITPVKKLASGTALLGDADTNHSTVGDGIVHTISIGSTLPNSTYIVLHSIVSLSTDPQNDLYHSLVIRNKTTTSFDVYFRESGVTTQDINLDWIIVGF